MNGKCFIYIFTGKANVKSHRQTAAKKLYIRNDKFRNGTRLLSNVFI